MKPRLRKRYYYRVRKDDKFLCGMKENCPSWGSVLSASETLSLSEAQTWAEDYRGKIEKIRLTGDQS